MLHIYAALAEKERSMISEHTRNALAKTNMASTASAESASRRWRDRRMLTFPIRYTGD
jgi:hypothetical protein